MASYRYRAEIPAKELGWEINNLDADVIIYSKPVIEDVAEARALKEAGKKIVVDFCDDHFNFAHYHEMHALADRVTCPTEFMANKIGGTVIPDPYEFAEFSPHCQGTKVLWFGHAVNKAGLFRVMDNMRLPVESFSIVSNMPGTIPWSVETLKFELFKADIVILPETAHYKSPNRCVEAIRSGCFVVAEPHPSIKDFKGLYVGDINEGIEWVRHNLQAANKMIKTAQNFIRKRYSPSTVANAWKKLVQELI